MSEPSFVDSLIAGSGVTFDFGQIIVTTGVQGTDRLVVAFHEDDARVGRITHLVYLLGMLMILVAPDTMGTRLEDLKSVAAVAWKNRCDPRAPRDQYAWRW